MDGIDSCRFLGESAFTCTFRPRNPTEPRGQTQMRVASAARTVVQLTAYSGIPSKHDHRDVVILRVSPRVLTNISEDRLTEFLGISGLFFDQFP